MYPPAKAGGFSLRGLGFAAIPLSPEGDSLSRRF